MWLVQHRIMLLVLGMVCVRVSLFYHAPKAVTYHEPTVM